MGSLTKNETSTVAPTSSMANDVPIETLSLAMTTGTLVAAMNDTSDEASALAAESSAKLKEQEHREQTTTEVSPTFTPLDTHIVEPTLSPTEIEVVEGGESREGGTMSFEERVDNFMRNFLKIRYFPYERSIIDEMKFGEHVRATVKKLEQDPSLDTEKMWEPECLEYKYCEGSILALWCYSRLHWAVLMEDEAMVEKTRHTIDVQCTMYTKKYSPLHVAAFLGNSNIVCLLMPKRDKCKDLFRTILSMAVHGENVLIVRQLLEGGEIVHINDKGKHGETALHVVAETGRTDILKEMKDVKELKWNEKNIYGETPLHIVAKNGAIDILKLMKDVKELKWNEKDICGDTPLHIVAKNGAIDILKEMKDVKELKWNEKNSGGNTPLHCAVWRCRVDILKEMKDVKKLKWNEKNDDGDTPLHVVAQFSTIDILKEMKNIEELSWNEEDNEGRTALELAHNARNHQKEKLLLEIEPVNRYIDSLFKDRQVFVDAANAILVGAALIASVTFASWLQPPLGFDNIDAHVHVEHNRGLQAFWVCNAFAFYFAMATVVSGAQSVLPRRSLFIRVIVGRIRTNLFYTSVLLAISIIFAVITFSIAGNIVLRKLQVTMIVPCVIGGGVCAISLMFLIRSIYEEWNNMRKV